MEHGLIIQPVNLDQLYEGFREIVRSEIKQLETPKKDTVYHTRKEAQKTLKISMPTLDEYTRKGIIQGSRLGSRILYTQEAIEAAVKQIPETKYQRRK